MSFSRSESSGMDGQYTEKLDALQARIGHFFRDFSLLKMAMTHPSAAEEEGRGRLASYERLEFLGDSVVNFLLAELIFNQFPGEDEGVLTKIRAWWISGNSLAESSSKLLIPECIRVGRGEQQSRGSFKKRIQACALEALFGAIYIDGGIKPARKLAQELWKDAVRKRGKNVLLYDAKTRLQEIRQKQSVSLPKYETESSGDGFQSSVYLDNEECGKGEGASRKAAEQEAAKDALSRLPE